MLSVGGQWLWQEVVLSHPNWFSSQFHQSVSWALPVFSWEPCSWDTWPPFQHRRERRVLPAPHEVRRISFLLIALPGKHTHWESKRCSLFISFNVRISFTFLLGMMAREDGIKIKFFKCYCLFVAVPYTKVAECGWEHGLRLLCLIQELRALLF